MERELKILILEDVPTDADLIEHELKKEKFSYVFKRVETEEDFTCQLEEFEPDLILSDYSLPQFTGMEALKLAKRKSLDIPFIIVTGSMNEEVAVECMKAGAWDYVTKEHLLRLAPAVKSAIERRNIIGLRKSAEARILQAKVDWESTFNSIPDMITIQDMEFNVLRANRAATQIIDFKKLDSSKLIKCFRHFHGTEKPPENCPGMKSLKTGKPVVTEMFEPHLNKHFEIRVIPLLDSEGVPERLVHLFRDMTERVAAKTEIQNLVEHLKKSKREWESTFDSASEIIALVDKDFTIKRCNKSLSEFVKKPYEEIIGKKYCEYFPCEYTQTDELSTPGKILPTIEIIVNNKHWFYVNSYDVFDDAGNYLHSVVIGTEITKLKDVQQSLVRSNEELEVLFLGLVEALVSALDAKSPWTKGHSERVAHYAELIAREMDFKDEDLKKIRLAGLLHDIGKIGTYDELLEKPERLTDEEFEIIKQHPSQGAKILEGIKQLHEIIPVVRHHHERMDGKGYPDGIGGEDLPVYARIMHVADSFDSMTSDRPYRKAPGKDYAVSEFVQYSGVQFDAGVVKAFMKVLEMDGDYRKENKCQT